LLEQLTTFNNVKAVASKSPSTSISDDNEEGDNTDEEFGEESDADEGDE
jgi:hypothetical protein